jgi:transcriptional regulator with XRE-family HTH domain
MTIRSLRRARGISQESLAAMAGIDRSYMSSVERGLRNVSVLNVARIAEALGVPVWELFHQLNVSPPVTGRPVDADSEAGPDLTDVPPNATLADGGTFDWEPHYLSLG